MELSYFQVSLAFLGTILLGMSKGGLKGLGILVVSLIAYVYGAKASTGILVPLFIIGDILAVIYFKKHVKIKYLIRFLPPMMIGVVLAAFLGNDWDEVIFKKWMSVIIVGSVLYMFWTEYKNIKIASDNLFLAPILGFCAGVATMLGNLAGPFSNLYFLVTKLPKNEIVGTAAWVFFIINIFKLPFHIFSWETINYNSLKINLYLAPLVIIGFFIGTKLLGLFNEKNYRKFLLIVTAIGAILILLK